MCHWPASLDRPAAVPGPRATHMVSGGGAATTDLRPRPDGGLSAVQSGPPPRALHRRIRALRLIGIRVPAQPFPWWPGCPPRLRSLPRSHSDLSRCLRSAFRRSLAPVLSFNVGFCSAGLPRSLPGQPGQVFLLAGHLLEHGLAIFHPSPASLGTSSSRNAAGTASPVARFVMAALIE